MRKILVGLAFVLAVGSLASCATYRDNTREWGRQREERMLRDPHGHRDRPRDPGDVLPFVSPAPPFP